VGAERPARLVEKFLTRAFVSVRIFPVKAMDKRTCITKYWEYTRRAIRGLYHPRVLPGGFSVFGGYNGN
jgi:hypothetical protein